MLNRKFNPHQEYEAVIYARMSDVKQNERSPDQQIAEIHRTIKSLGLKWKVQRVFRDDGVKGAYIRKRPQFMSMLNGIRSGDIHIDLILVDTTERFARSENMNSIRKELWEKYGVLVLTAESSFSDPLSSVGRIYSAVEAMRATEENRIKGHQVLRAKRDAISQGYWPGGPPPFGYCLEKVIQKIKGVDHVVGSKLVPADATKYLIRLAFERAAETGEGRSAIARYLKSRPDFPSDMKHLSGATVGYWLVNTIYMGVLTWAKHCTGIVDDVRKLERNEAGDVITVEQFCEPIVSTELWNRVRILRESRRMDRRAAHGNGKLLKPLAKGFTINFILSGLARCAHCGSSMRPVTSGRTSNAGATYTYYMCSRAQDDGCDNYCWIPERWLRSQVIGYIKSKLFPLAVAEGSSNDKHPHVPVWIDELKKHVKTYLVEKQESMDDPRPGLRDEISKINSQISGWVQSLGSASLPNEVRHQIEQQMHQEIDRKIGMEQSIAEFDYMDRSKAIEVDDADILKRVERLDEVLAQSNPTLAHLELSLYIDRIDCFKDRTVVARFCQLGLAGQSVIDSIALQQSVASSSVKNEQACKPRRRARLHAYSDAHDSMELESLAMWATDPDRFAGLDERWFETVRLHVPEATYWATQHAIEVSELRLEGKTHQQLADHFGVTAPTIRKALRIGRKLDPRFSATPKKMARARWHEDNAAAVFNARKRMTILELVAQFGKSDVTLRKAVLYAQNVLGMK